MSGSLFAGWKVLCTGIPQAEKEPLCAQLAGQGATLLQGFSPAIQPDVVICRSVLSESYASCRRLYPGTPAVTPEWATESMARGALLPAAEARFTLQCFTGLVICLSGLTSTAKHALTEEVLSHGGRHSPSLDRRCTHLVTITTESDKYRFAVSHGIPCVTPEWVQACVVEGAYASPARFPCSAGGAKPVPPRSEDDGALDGCHLWLVGCSSEEQREALRAVRQTLAKRFATQHPLVTHVIIGTQLREPDASQAAALARASPAVRAVRLDWLLRCGEERRRLDCAGFAYDFSKAVSSERDAGPCSQASRGAAGTEDAARERTGMFASAWFTLAALSDGADAALARRIIKAHGGRIFVPDTVYQVPQATQAYALCPPSLPADQLAALQHSRRDFAMVPERNRMTLYWLDCCQQVGKLLEQSRGAPCYKPLPYALPIPGMARVSVCISGYDTGVRAAIDYSMKLVGSTASTEAMTRANTHLIVPEAKGEKFKHCKPFGVLPVTAEWLVDSIEQGRLQPEDKYAPRPPRAVAATSTAQPPAAATTVQPPAATSSVQPPAATSTVQPPAAATTVQPPAASSTIPPPQMTATPRQPSTRTKRMRAGAGDETCRQLADDLAAVVRPAAAAAQEIVAPPASRAAASGYGRRPSATAPAPPGPGQAVDAEFPPPDRGDLDLVVQSIGGLLGDFSRGSNLLGAFNSSRSPGTRSRGSTKSPSTTTTSFAGLHASQLIEYEKEGPWSGAR